MSNCSTNVNGSDTNAAYSRLALSGKHSRAYKKNYIKMYELQTYLYS